VLDRLRVEPDHDRDVVAQGGGHSRRAERNVVANAVRGPAIDERHAEQAVDLGGRATDRDGCLLGRHLGGQATGRQPRHDL
jgi:hypothetical protein